ncbi:hypothetical protein ACJX0J_005655, partial [Zea mays]
RGHHMRIRQHVNPLSSSFSEPTGPPEWKEVFDDPLLPLMVDIGCGSGRFLIWHAKNSGKSQNYLGLEIRQKLVERAQFWVNELELMNVYFMFANATLGATSQPLCIDTRFDGYSGILAHVNYVDQDLHCLSATEVPMLLMKMTTGISVPLLNGQRFLDLNAALLLAFDKCMWALFSYQNHLSNNFSHTQFGIAVVYLASHKVVVKRIKILISSILSNLVEQMTKCNLEKNKIPYAREALIWTKLIIFIVPTYNLVIQALTQLNSEFIDIGSAFLHWKIQITKLKMCFEKKEKKDIITLIGAIVGDAQGSTEDLGSDTDELDEKELGNEGNQSFQKLAEIVPKGYLTR